MAEIFVALRTQLFRRSSSLTSRPRPRKFVCQFEARRQRFHASPILRKTQDDEDEVDEADDVEGELSKSKQKKPFIFSLDDLDPDEQAEYKSRTPKQQEEFRNEAKAVYDYLNSRKFDSILQRDVSNLVSKVNSSGPHLKFTPERVKPGFFNMGEEDFQDMGEDEEFEGDDLNEMGHAELDRHRELRHYARIAAWEMPLLSKFAKPFELPDEEKILRFRYTTYMGENHPAGKKVVLEFCTKDLPKLTEAQRIKLIKLIGPRYNPETDLVKMSCESFENQAQNKRYLGDLVETLMTEARDATDMFEDVPLDFRHHKFEQKPMFPPAWKLTEDRRVQLEGDRRERLEAQVTNEAMGRLIDGTSIIEKAMAAMPVHVETQPLLAAQTRKQTGRRGSTQPLR